MEKSGLILVCSGLLLLAGCSGFRSELGNQGDGVGEQKKVAAPEKETYACVFTSEPIKIDGFLDEPAWQKAKILNFIRPGTFKEPISKTEGRFLYDNNYLYVGIKAYDQDIWSYYTERDSSTCLEDVLEIFIKPDPIAHPDGPIPTLTLKSMLWARSWMRST